MTLSQQHIDSILAENEVRTKAILAQYDPITGKDAPGNRVELCIKDYPIKTQYVPIEMMDVPLIKEIRECGSIRTFLKTHKFQGGIQPEKDDIVRQIRKIRHKYDFTNWAFWEVKIEHKVTGQMVHFVLNYAQIRVLETCEELRKAGLPINLVIAKARQWGGSTFCIFYQWWLAIKWTVKHSFVVAAQNQKVAGNITKMLVRSFQTYDPWDLGLDDDDEVQLIKDSLSGEYVLRNKKGDAVTQSSIRIGSVVNPDGLRGYAGEGAHYSEVGVWKDTPGMRPADLIRGISGGILQQANAMQVMESTPKGAGNFFHTEYQRAKSGLSAFKPVFIPWYYIPHDRMEISDKREFVEWLWEHRMDNEPSEGWLDSGKYYWRLWTLGATLEGINWYRYTRKTYSDFADMASEAPSDDIEAFQFSGSKVFDIYDIAAVREDCKEPIAQGTLMSKAQKGREALTNIVFYPTAGGELKIWEHPDKESELSHRYLVTVDIGGHTKTADFHAITVLDRFPMIGGGVPEVVAEMRYHSDHDILAYDAARLAKYYNDALLVIESNTLETSDDERDTDGASAEYILDIISRIYRNLYARKASAAQIKKGKPTMWGFHTNASTKLAIISFLKECAKDHLWIERSTHMPDEMAIYEKDERGKYNATPGAGNHDDVLMSRAIALYICYFEMPSPEWKDDSRGVMNLEIDEHSTSHF